MDIELSLAEIKNKSKTIMNFCRQVGPWVISISDKLSEAQARHDLRKVGVALLEKEMSLEIESFSAIKKDKMKQYYSASPEERIYIRRDLDELDKEGRRFETILGAVKLLSERKEDENKKDISPHWMDKFDELARAKNEDWRQDLLSKALMLEAESPGSISPRALWLIGTIEEELFHAYAILLDVSSVIGGGYIIPDHSKFESKPIPSCALGEHLTIGNLTFLLSDLGLLGGIGTSAKQFLSGANFSASYGPKIVKVQVLKDVMVHGIIPTKLGNMIAKLYQAKLNPLGKEIFESWLENLNKKTLNIIESS